MTIRDSVANGINQAKEAIAHTVGQTREKVDQTLTERPSSSKAPTSSANTNRHVDMRDDVRRTPSPLDNKNATNMFASVTPPPPAAMSHTRERKNSVGAVQGGSLNRQP